MAKIEKLVPGQVLWSVESERMGNTMMRTESLFTVRITAIDPEGKWVEASWNGNPARRRYDVSKLRTTKPVMIRGSMGTERLATRSEVAAMKAKKGGE